MILSNKSQAFVKCTKQGRNPGFSYDGPRHVLQGIWSTVTKACVWL